MASTIEFDDAAKKQLKKLPRQAQAQILDYLEHQVAPMENPRQRGEGLTSNLIGLWRYRVRDYRIVCRIDNHALRILVIKVGHRRDVYE